RGPLALEQVRRLENRPDAPRRQLPVMVAAAIGDQYADSGRFGGNAPGHRYSEGDYWGDKSHNRIFPRAWRGSTAIRRIWFQPRSSDPSAGNSGASELQVLHR